MSKLKPPSGRAAFTLVELLVVIGIIALLIAILFPSLRKARESANRAVCLSNVRQVGAGLMLYAQNNRGVFPYCTSFARVPSRLNGGGAYPATYGQDLVLSGDFVNPIAGGPDFGPHPEDWIYWQQKNAPAYRDLAESAIARYLAQSRETLENLLRCPTDTEALRRAMSPLAAPGEGPYTFSYTVNQNMSFCKITEVTRSAEKLLVVEEESPIDGRWATIDGLDLLTIRHGKKTAPAAGRSINGFVGVNIPACFCDGHADLIEQDFANDRRHHLRGD